MATQYSERSAPVPDKGEPKQTLFQMPVRNVPAQKSEPAMMRALKQIRPAFAAEIEAADAIDQPALCEQAAVLQSELKEISKEWDQAIKNYNEAFCELADDPAKAERFATLRETPTTTDSDRSRKFNELRSFAPGLAAVEENLDNVMKRRSELSAKLQVIQEQKDAPLFTRMMCAADLIRWGIHALAAEVLLDLIQVAAEGGSKGNDAEINRAEWFLRKIASVHRLNWLDALIEVKPPEITSYRKLRAAMLLAAMNDPFLRVGME
jgi:hypothetical protein